MGTVTAILHVGASHPNHGGISPSHQLLLSENSRPAWTLVDLDRQDPPVVWIPTVENMLEDGLLMAGLLALEDPGLAAAATTCFRHGYGERVELHSDIPDADRKRLHQLCRGIGPVAKVVVTVLEGSTVAGQVGVLANYGLEVEVCPSVYQRTQAGGANEVQARGSLPGASGRLTGVRA